MANTCYGCGANLKSQRVRFERLLALGYDKKDAAAKVLHTPGSLNPINSCCVVGLETNLDPNKELNERQEIKDMLNEKADEMRMQQGLPRREREKAMIFSVSDDMTQAGRFLLENFPYDDPALLAGNFDERIQGRRNGFQITNIGYVSQAIATKHRWNAVPLALFSGNIAIIPITFDGINYHPGKMMVRDSNQQTRYLGEVDKSLIGADIISYEMRPTQISNNKQDDLFHVITVLKQFPEKIVA